MRGGELSLEQRTFILAQVEAGAKTREIAGSLGCSISCVNKTIQRWKTTGSNASRSRMGTPTKLTRRDHRKLSRAAKKQPTLEYKTLMKEMGYWEPNSPTPLVSKRTVQRALAEEGYRKFRAKRRPKINSATAKLRCKFAADWQDFRWGRETLKFSDECSVARGSGHNTSWVWRLPEDKWSHKMVEEISTGRQSARMVWAAVWMTPGGRVGRSPLVIMTRDSLAARRGYSSWSYIQALEEGLWQQYKPGEWFMQDNAPIHTACDSKEWLEIHGVATIDWPPYSPDLNPIEHLWWALKKKLHELYPEFDTMGESESDWDRFELGLVEAWAAIPDTLIKKLITTMPHRLNAVRQVRGYQTKY